jgi:hypothetical protein
MRSLPVRCLVLVLSPAIAIGNARAVLRLNADHAEPCPQEHAHRTGRPRPIITSTVTIMESRAAAIALAAPSAIYLALEPGIAPAELSAQICYDVLNAALVGLALLPEPAPPTPRHIELNLARVAPRVAGSFGACRPANTPLSVIATVSVAGVRVDRIFRRCP